MKDRPQLNEGQSKLLTGLAKAISVAMIVLELDPDQCIQVLQVTIGCLEESKAEAKEAQKHVSHN